MIQIKIDSKIKDKIEKIHWKWFSARMEQKAWPNNQSHKDFIFANIIFLDPKEKKLNKKTQEKLKNFRLRKLIIGGPNLKIANKGIYEFFQNINKKYKWHNTGTMSQYPNETKTAFNARKKKWKEDNKHIKDLQTAFGYEDFVSSPQNEQWYIEFKKNNGGNDWNIKILSEKLGVDVCPYCNRQYIFGYELQDKKRNIAEIDHFKPKGHYPYLSCSLYNFVPSCHTCNSIKQAQDEDILYPYTDSLDYYTQKKKNARFIFKAKNGSVIKFPISKRTPKEIELEINPNYSKSAEAKNAKKLFHIDEIYTKHILELNDIIERYKKCTPKQFNALYNFMTNDLKIRISEKNLKKLILGLPIDATKEYPLRKFKEDIIDYIEEKAKANIK